MLISRDDFTIVNKVRIAMLVIAGGIFILILKLLAYLVSDSVALLSDAMESIINVVASVMMLSALIISARKEDETHKYGHRKAENISALIEGILIIIAAVLIVQATIGRLFNPVGFNDIDLGLIISLCATSLNGVLAVIMLREAKRNRSMALEGDAKHLFSDVVSSVGVVIGLFVASITGIFILDPLIALFVAILLVKMGIDVFRRTSKDLMDSNCAEEEKIIIAVLEKTQGYIEYHGLKTRRSGEKVFMEVHLCVDGEVSVKKAHELTEKIEKELELTIPGISSTIHIEDQTQCQTLASKDTRKE
jgi:cation diffusion facilitator family transporter